MLRNYVLDNGDSSCYPICEGAKCRAIQNDAFDALPDVQLSDSGDDALLNLRHAPSRPYIDVEGEHDATNEPTTR